MLRHAIEVPASVAEVWEALTTTNGVRSWAVPVALLNQSGKSFSAPLAK